MREAERDCRRVGAQAKDELEDAVQRKRLLVQQLQLIMEGSEGAALPSRLPSEFQIDGSDRELCRQERLGGWR